MILVATQTEMTQLAQMLISKYIAANSVGNKCCGDLFIHTNNSDSIIFSGTGGIDSPLTATTTGIGTVTSVSLSAILGLASPTGSPITNSGTLGYTLDEQSINQIFASPAFGAPGQPSFRNLVATDFPNIFFKQGGNLFSTTAKLGTLDNQKLEIYANNTKSYEVDTTGKLLVNMTPAVGTLKLQVTGGIYSASNVGIRTSTPTTALTIGSDIDSTNTLFLYAPNASVGIIQSTVGATLSIQGGDRIILQHNSSVSGDGGLTLIIGEAGPTGYFAYNYFSGGGANIGQIGITSLGSGKDSFFLKATDNPGTTSELLLYNKMRFVNIPQDNATTTIITIDANEKVRYRDGSTIASSNLTANVRTYGAVGDGVTDDSTAFLAAIATGLVVEVPGGNYLVLQKLVLSIGQAIFGYGRQSNIITTTNGTTVSLATAHHIIQAFDDCKISNLRFTGNGSTTYTFPWTSQNGIWIQGNDVQVINCEFNNLRGSGILSVKTTLTTFQDVRISGCKFINSTIGIFTYVGSEYMIISNCSVYNCSVGINERGANNNYTNCNVSFSTVGLMAFGNGGNSDHTSFTACTFNHNMGNQISGIVTSLRLVSCDFISNPVTVTESVKVFFIGCAFNAQTYTITAATAKETVFINCYSFAGTSPTIVASGAGPAVATQVNCYFSP